MDDKRDFDWGPPTRGADKINDYIIYFIIFLVFALGLWLLLDIRTDKSNLNQSITVTEAVKPSNQNAIAQTHKEAPLIPQAKFSTLDTLNISKKKKPDIEFVYSEKSEFYVQLGAFEDEESAKEIFGFLKENDFEPILKKPDKQFEIYRVVVGPFASEADADYRAEKLNDLGLPCFVVEY